MTGIVSTALRLGSAATSLAGIFGGGPLSLGDVDFSDYAVPETVRRATKQQITIHKFPGGARWIDRMGPDPEPVEWSGVFLGGQASAQAMAVEAMVAAGEVVPLTAGDFTADVVVASFDAKYAYHHVAYTIACVILPPVNPKEGEPELGILDDLQSGIATVQRGIATAQRVVSVASQVTGALGISVPCLQRANAALATASGYASAAGGLVAGGAALVRTAGAIGTAVTTLRDGVASVGAGISRVADGTAAGLTAAGAQAGAQASLVQAQSAAQRADMQLGGLY